MTKRRRKKLSRFEKDRAHTAAMLSCIGKAKEGFSTKKEAIAACRKREAEVEGLRLWTYRCLYCGMRHKTSKDPNSRS